MTLLEGFGETLKITFGALLIGIVIGTFVAIVKVLCEGNKKLKIFDVLCNIYLTVIRGTPVVVQLLIMFFIVFVSAEDGTMVATLTFGINSGAYVAETIRSGILAIDKGQTEAGRSLGFSAGKTMWLIVLPQAFKNILPAIGNEMIALLKETSVAGYVAVVDLTKAGNQIRNTTYDQFNPIICVALVYLTVVLIMTRLLNMLERRLRKSER
ncbi:MAG: amino acid ABC transporter permease [Ruminococcaceae bacterium]|nr:amino acid ABC transporter permease [Oscillospiraceae bacterium]